MRRSFSLLCVLLAACGQEPPAVQPIGSGASVASLAERSADYSPRVQAITENVWIAIGYGLANSILIEGEDGLIVIDTMETLDAGRTVARAFRQISDKPLKAIIYTHNHADHVFGAQAYIEELAPVGASVDVIAHASTAALVHRVVSEFRPIVTARSLRMFGSALDDAGFVNNGIGPRLTIEANSQFGFVKPNQVFDERLQLSIAGVAVELIRAPGETDDQLFVWLPEQGVLCPGDNIYQAFPNLYTIRGTPFRSLKQWAASIDAMRALPVRHLLPSHTLPLAGEQAIRQVLTDYRDAIRYVRDQSIRWINAGLTPDEIVERLQLPPHLAASPWLQEHYGSVRWSARAVFAGNLGWFDGNPSTLDPLPPRTQAEKMAQLAGSVDALSAQLVAAQDAQEWQWALQLSDHLLRLRPDDAAARQIRIEALIALGEASSNPNARHYYLMSARELRDGLRLTPLQQGSESTLRSLPMVTILEALSVNLRAEEVLDTVQRVGFSFPDIGEDWTLTIRRGVTELQPGLASHLDIHAHVDSLIFKQLLGRQINGPLAIARDFDFPKGNGAAFARFLLLFQPVRAAPEPAPLAALAGEQ